MTVRAYRSLAIMSFILGSCSATMLNAPQTALADTANVPCDATATLPADNDTTPEGMSATTTATDSTSAIGASNPTPQQLVRFNEVLPDPAGADSDREFIEIENYGDESANISGWSITNANGKTFSIDISIGAHGLFSFMFTDTHLSLVNSGMTLILKDSSGVTKDSLTYGATKVDKAYARKNDGDWEWTSSPSPGAVNLFDAPVIAAQVETPPPATAAVLASTVTTTPSTSTATTEPVATTVAPSTVFIEISEFLPDPTGSDDAEWIELHNLGPTDAILDGLMIDDAEGGSKPFALTGLTIAPNVWILIQKATSKIGLNNDGDSVRLLAASGTVLSDVSYANAPVGKSFAKIGDVWKWVAASTPSAENFDSAASDDLSIDADAGVSNGKGAVESHGEEITLSDITDLETEREGLVEVLAVITLPPGRVGKRTFMVSDEGGSRGVTVRAYGSRPLPALKPGDRVRVTGRTSPASGQMLLATTGQGVKKISAGVLSPVARDIADISAEENGTAIETKGEVLRSSNASMTITDAVSDKKITVRLATPLKEKIAKGTQVLVKGVIRMRNDVIEMYSQGESSVTQIIDKDAIALTESLPTETNESSDKQASQIREARIFGIKPDSRTTAVATALILATAAALAIGMALRKRQIVMSEGFKEPEALETDR